ncbi:hypothetical protein FRB99_003256 [Tulasnella sp. 403]|nr:hypothetical protein FRB99_003256 [Tulasnella sp. 403]
MRIPTATFCVALALALQLSAAPLYHSTTLAKRGGDDGLTGVTSLRNKFQAVKDKLKTTTNDFKNMIRKPEPKKGSSPPSAPGESISQGKSLSLPKGPSDLQEDSRALITQYDHYMEKGVNPLDDIRFKHDLWNLAGFGSPDGTPLSSLSTEAGTKFSHPWQAKAWDILLDPANHKLLPETNQLTGLYRAARDNGFTKPASVIISRLDSLLGPELGKSGLEIDKITGEIVKKIRL